MLMEDVMGVFQTLKKASLKAPVLAFADFNEPFLLETDTSKLGLGAVLSQKDQWSITSSSLSKPVFNCSWV